ncbi:ribonuclease H-like domain-containing protein [Annulohypoxylon truncatum]|uniref:ribonuclease H-like domain-containing protein n=1 Tax=Annulohypoxylon truncatum TaxID=327061 RepID=UPI0020084DEE|nr:ribonuclease H-like domain-containing protein [Annulohypoxylon truncatum]KAI1204223.1 ribonuclease H-like domain-containing protein [Annulohypoxylon truncatum]
MVYIMKFYVDGGCRRNGYDGAIGAAAACWMSSNPNVCQHWTKPLSTYEYNATNQRAEILAIILALELALEKYDNLDSDPKLDVTIHSDSRYAVGCMNEWIYTWANNGWRNARGGPVVNRDMIEEASDLDDRIKELGIVKYVYIPREQNNHADRACNKALDELE